LVSSAQRKSRGAEDAEKKFWISFSLEREKETNCRREIVGDWHLFLELKKLISANQTVETKRQIHIADDFAARAFSFFRSPAKK
jgi:hypothetical protein